MANQKITELTANTSPLRTDVFPMVDDPAGTPLTQKLTFLNLLKAIFPYAAKSSAYPATTDDFWLDVTTGGGGVTITLPAVATTPVGFPLLITKADNGAGALTIDGNASETINGATTKATSTQYNGFLIWNTGVEWRAIALTGA